MKKSELKQLIREEIQRLNEDYSKKEINNAKEYIRKKFLIPLAKKIVKDIKEVKLENVLVSFGPKGRRNNLAINIKGSHETGNSYDEGHQIQVSSNGFYYGNPRNSSVDLSELQMIEGAIEDMNMVNMLGKILKQILKTKEAHILGSDDVEYRGK